MSLFRLYPLLSFSLLGACANIPDSYAPPVQRPPIEGPEPSPVANFVSMGDSNATAYIVGDVAPTPDSYWRWTGKRPELRFFLDSIDHLKFKVDFSISDATFPETGPVEIGIFLNGHLLDTVKCAKAGAVNFEKPVPPEFLKPKSFNIAAMEIDKVWVSKEDGARLGFILIRAGFVQ